MKSMKELSKEFTKQCLKNDGWPDTLEEAIVIFDTTANYLKQFNINTDKAREYLINEYKSLDN